MSEYDTTNIWITGGGSGIGASLARLYAESGVNVIISGRNIKKLECVADDHDRITTIQLDVSSKDSWQKAKKQVTEKFTKIDLVIFNAGICEYVDLPDFSSETFFRVLQTNFMGIVYGIECTLPLLRKSDSPLIAAVTSSVAPLPLPRAEAYGASKAAATYLLNSLRIDLLKEKIDVSVILPGFVSTPLTDVNDFPMPFKISADEAAVKIMQGLKSRKKEIYFPGRFTWPLRFLAVLPMALQQIFTKRFVK